jgi:hypothetical protein
VLETVPAVRKVTPSGSDGTWLRVELLPSSGSGSSNAVLAALTQADIPILSFEAERGRLQDVFLHLTEAAQARA